MSFLGGLQQGVQFGQRKDAFNQQQQIGAAQLQGVQAKTAASAQKGQADAAEQFKGLMSDAATYVRQLPPDPQQRSMGAKAYLETRGADPEMIMRLEQSGFLNDLNDQKLDAFMSSMRDEQVLKDKEVLLGRDGKPVYENRYNAPQVVADGSALVGDDGTALYENAKDVAPVDPTATMQEYAMAQQGGFTGSFLDYQKQLKQAGQSAGGQSSFGKNVVYAQDEDGNTVAYQLNDRGDAKPVNFGEGFSPLSPMETTRQREVGKALGKREMQKTKAGMALSQAREKSSRIRSAVLEAQKLSTGGNTGLIQGRMTVSQKAANLDAKLETIKANIGFKELQDMRDSSPTGGALGQVSEREIAFLQALVGNLSRLQDDKTLDTELEKVYDSVEGSFKRLEEAYQADYENGLIQNAPSANNAAPSQEDPLGIR